MAVAAAMQGGALPREPRRLHLLLAHYPQVAAAFSSGIGAIVLVGWIAGIDTITQPLRGAPVMTAITAVMSLLSGVALWLRAGERRARRSRFIARVTAAVVLLMALLVLLQYVTGFDLGIDRPVPEERLGPWPAGRPSPQAAVAFAFVALALLSLDRVTGKQRFISDYLAFVPGGLALLALLGYLFGVPMLYGASAVVPYVGVSVPTALVLLALSVGLLAAHLDRGMLSIVVAPDAGGVVARQMLAGLAMLPPIAIVVILGARMGWYALPIAASLLLFVALAEGTTFILVTAKRLSRIDAAQRRIADELRASEARIRTLVEQASDGIFLADREGRYTDVNPAGCAMLGYTRDELVGKTIADLLAPADHARLQAESELVRSGSTARGEWLLRRGDGSFAFVEVVARLLSDGRWQAIARDISERKQAEEKLASAYEAERELRADLEAVDRARAVVSEAVATLQGADIDSVLAQVAEQARVLTNAEYAAVALGTDAEHELEHWVMAGAPEEVARAIGRIPHPVSALGIGFHEHATLPVAGATAQPAFLGVPPHQLSVRSFLAMPIPHRGLAIGSLYVANKRDAAAFSARDARLVELLADGVVIAIETARAYAAETGRRVWMQSIVDQIPDGVIVADERGRITAVNRAVKVWAIDDSAANLDTWRDPKLFDVRDPQGRPLPVDELPLRRVLRTGQPTPNQEFQVRHPDGRMVPADARAAPIRDETGKLVGAVVVARDISERKEVERLREEWIAIIAHDLRQPVSAIVAAAGILTDKLAPPEKQPQILDKLQRAAWRLNRMIDDLLDAARIAANRLTVDPQHADLVEVVARVIEHAQMAQPSVPIELAAPEKQAAWIDCLRIEQVLENLVSNAIKYRTPDTPVRVEVAREGDAVKVAVCNEGTTIKPEETQQLFTRFTRTRQARKAGTPGLGLGLYISKGLVEAHGGRIWVDVESGQTRVYFTVPASPPA